MLESIRKRQNNLIFTILILMVVAVMAMFGINQFDKKEGDSRVVLARVNGDPITVWDLQLGLSEIFGKDFDEKLVGNPYILEKLAQMEVRYRLFSQQAQKMDFAVSDRELADHIRSIPHYQKNGKFDAVWYQQLPNRGLEEKWRRQRMKARKLQQYLAERVRLTPMEVRLAFEVKSSKGDLEYAKINFDALAPQTPPTSKQMDEFLKTTPEAELGQYYEAHRSDFTEKAVVDLRKIRVSVPFEATASQKSLAKGKIEELGKQITPENFTAIARKHSDDEYAQKGGETGWVTRGTLQKPLEDAIDQLEAGGISAPIETQFGYFIIQVKAKKPERIHPLSEVKKSVAEKLYSEKTKQKFVEDKRKAWEAELLSGHTIEPELRAFKIELKKTGPFSLGEETIPGIGKAEGIIDGFFELTPTHPIAKRLYFFENHYYFIKLKNVEFAKESEFKKEQNAIEESAKQELKTAVLGTWTEALAKKSTIKNEISFTEKEAGSEDKE